VRRIVRCAAPVRPLWPIVVSRSLLVLVRLGLPVHGRWSGLCRHVCWLVLTMDFRALDSGCRFLAFRLDAVSLASRGNSSVRTFACQEVFRAFTNIFSLEEESMAGGTEEELYSPSENNRIGWYGW
jgi:hypothetical protein